jgi:hypothetical protein
MNYTRPNDPDYVDTPEDWLNGSLIFGRALGLIFKEGEGIVADLKGDAQFPADTEVKKVIVFKEGEMVKIIPCMEDLEEGQWVMIGQK